MPSRILMIEDDRRLAEMVREYLGQHGETVTIRGDAASGLSTAKSEEFDAVILDVMLPDLDGFEVCKRLRRDSDIPIVMLTARGDETDRIVGLELGADDYLPKPFNPRELMARLRAVLRRSGATSPAALAPLRFGRLDIDRDARRVLVEGRECDLTSHQFNLLTVLAESAGRTLSRDTIMDRVRGEEVGAFDRSIDVHISRIRSEIEDDPRHPRRIVTVRGVGYLFAREQD